jgi:hypothetical protein
MLNSITSPLDGIRSPFGAIRNPFAAYNIGGQTPQTIADFEADKYRANGTTSTAASLLTHTRAGTATYTDNTGTLQTAASGELRKDNHIWDGSSWVKRCLVEPQSTNLVTYSEDFTDASWTKTKANVAGTAQGPDGVSDSATILSDDSSTGTGTVFIFDAITTTVSTAYTYSLFAKADQLSWVRLQLGGFTASGGTETAYFNLSDGTVGTVSTANLTAKIEDFGDGWYRCCVSFTSNASATSGSVVIVVADADGDVTVDLDGTSSILIYGAQFEASSVPTSYIPTAGATVTRPADALSIDSTLLPYDSTAMTIAMDGEMTYADTDVGEEIVWFKWENSTSNRVYAYLYTAVGTGSPIFRQVASGVVDQVPAVITDDYSPGINVPFNIASRNTSSDLNGAIDGTALTANTTPTALPDLSATDFQIAPKGVVNIKSLRILGGYGATDAELEAATT